jgi:hypothetical protein
MGKTKRQIEHESRQTMKEQVVEDKRNVYKRKSKHKEDWNQN